jgi:hypothetical protein
LAVAILGRRCFIIALNYPPKQSLDLTRSSKVADGRNERDFNGIQMALRHTLLLLLPLACVLVNMMASQEIWLSALLLRELYSKISSRETNDEQPREEVEKEKL